MPGDDRARRRRAAREPRRARVHQAPHAQGGRRVRRRGVGALLLPRLLAGRLGRRPVPAHARADLEDAAGSSRRSSRRTASRYFITGEINTPVADVALKLQELKERYAPEGDGLAPRRDLGRRRRLALQRAPVEHRAAAAPEPRGALAGADGAQARRGARADPLVSEALAVGSDPGGISRRLTQGDVRSGTSRCECAPPCRSRPKSSRSSSRRSRGRRLEAHSRAIAAPPPLAACSTGPPPTGCGATYRARSTRCAVALDSARAGAVRNRCVRPPVPTVRRRAWEPLSMLESRRKLHPRRPQHDVVVVRHEARA